MAVTKRDIDKQREKLRLRSEQLNAKVRIQENRDKLENINAQLRQMKGR